MELKVHDQEVELQQLWKRRQLARRNLLTMGGQKVEILFEGVENFDSGPDFKDAVLKLDGTLKKGDVEVHLDSRGWYEHGHDRDPAYNRVILHLVARPGMHSWIEREDGVRVPQLCLNPYEERHTQKNRKPRDDVAVVVDDCPLSRMGMHKIEATLKVAGEARFRQKVQQMREELHAGSYDQVFYRHLLRALGYSKNEIPFQRLAEKIPVELVFSELQWVDEATALQKCEAMFFGAAGLLPLQSEMSETAFSISERSYIKSLQDRWRTIQHRHHITAMQGHEWRFFRLRPLNFPTRRLAGAARVLVKHVHSGFVESFGRILSAHRRVPARILRELESGFVVPPYGFWKNHYRFSAAAPSGKAVVAKDLIGRERAKEIVLNIVLPVMFLYAHESGESSLETLLREVYYRFPKTAENVLTRTMVAQLFQDEKPPLPKTAFIQQAMLHLYKRYCKPGRCAECLRLDSI